MPTSPREGQPTWIDYTCQEFESTTNFYSEIFGWEFTDQGPDFGHYNMITKGGATVGGAMRAVHMDGTPNPLAPAMWTTYLHTDDISGVYAASLEAGAAPIAEPMAVGPLGQMAVITDPTGAGVGMWQARRVLRLRHSPDAGHPGLVRTHDRQLPSRQRVLRPRLLLRHHPDGGVPVRHPRGR